MTTNQTKNTTPAPQAKGPNKSLVFFVGLLFLFVGVMFVYFAYQKYQRQNSPGRVTKVIPKMERPPEVEGLVKEFLLTDRSSQQWTSTEMKGKVWLASFFFSSCPHNCRQQNQTLQDLHAEYAKKGVTFLSITCDPSKDTPERLSEYAQDFTTDVEQWKFLTGDLTYIRRIGAERFLVPVQEGSHTERVMLVDKWGNTRGRFAWQKPEELAELRKSLDELLQETEPPKKDKQQPEA